MSKKKHLTVNELKNIMEKAQESDAKVLVYIKNDKTDDEYVVTRVGQFSVVPNLTLTIELNDSGSF